MPWKNSGQKIKRDSRGRGTILTLEEQVLGALEYWREYRTYFHIATNWGVSESTICRIVIDIESTLMKTAKFPRTGKKALLKNSDYPAVVAIDVTETAIERQKKQNEYYLNNNKCHTLKTQLVINQETGAIICTAFGQGHCHDFSSGEKK